MTRYVVSVEIETDCDDEYEAACNAYKTLSQLLASPSRGRIASRVVDTTTGAHSDIDLFDGVVEVDPLFASQVLGFRHLVWVSQNPPRSGK